MINLDNILNSIQDVINVKNNNKAVDTGDLLTRSDNIFIVIKPNEHKKIDNSVFYDANSSCAFKRGYPEHRQNLAKFAEDYFKTRMNGLDVELFAAAQNDLINNFNMENMLGYDYSILQVVNPTGAFPQGGIKEAIIVLDESGNYKATIKSDVKNLSIFNADQQLMFQQNDDLAYCYEVEIAFDAQTQRKTITRFSITDVADKLMELEHPFVDFLRQQYTSYQLKIQMKSIFRQAFFTYTNHKDGIAIAFEKILDIKNGANLHGKAIINQTVNLFTKFCEEKHKSTLTPQFLFIMKTSIGLYRATKASPYNKIWDSRSGIVNNTIKLLEKYIKSGFIIAPKHKAQALKLRQQLCTDKDKQYSQMTPAEFKQFMMVQLDTNFKGYHLKGPLANMMVVLFNELNEEIKLCAVVNLASDNQGLSY